MRDAKELFCMPGSRRILVVDDDELQLRALKRQCRHENAFTLSVADNAVDALVMIGASKPDLVVMDVLMSRLDGVEACRRLKANPTTSEIPVILASVEMSEEL